MKEKDRITTYKEESKKGLNAYSLTGIGIGGIVGAGFFLGSSLAINQAGPAVIIAFLFGGFIMSQVLGAMTSISVNRPVRGSFRVYVEDFLGEFAGFTLGWVIFVSGILSIGSEAIAAGVFLRYWIPNISLPILSISTLILVICINSLGVKYFGYIESGMAFLKIITIILFIVVGGIFIFNHGIVASPNPFVSYKEFLPNNISGLFQSMLVVVFTYSGISTVAMATSEVVDPKKDIPKATIFLTFGIVLLYMLSMTIIVSIVSWRAINVNVSPFVQSFSKMNMNWAASSVNGVILIAAISVMSGTYFGCIQMLISLSESRKAPKLFINVTKKGFYKNAWMFTAITSISIVAISFILSTKLFYYLISACSYFSFLNWIINLFTYIMWLKHRKKEEKYKSPLIFGSIGAYSTIIAILILIVMSLKVVDFRMGFYSAVVMLLIITSSYLLVKNNNM